MNLVIVVPTFNEAEGIETFLDRVRDVLPEADILIVDDQSPDGTGDLISERAKTDQNLHLFSRSGPRGLGAAYRAGFDWAIQHGYDVIVQMDADLSHPPARIPALAEAVTAGADLAIGSRYVPGGATENWDRSRRLISWAGNLFVRLVLNLKVADATAGFRAYRNTALEAINVVDSESNGYSFQIENTWRARRCGLTITEVPITFCDRTIGKSKMSGNIAAEAILRVVSWRWDEIKQAIRGKSARS